MSAELPARPSLEFLKKLAKAAAAGNLAAVAEAIADHPELVNERHDGTTALHLAVPHPDVARHLLEHGADPNARDDGDNALPLHFAAGRGPIETVRALLARGSDARGEGDLHQLEVIGWATVFDEPRPDVVELLVAHGARHHAFSAIALGDRELLRRVATDDRAALARRLSHHEQGQSVLHYVIAPADGLVGGRFRNGDHYLTLDTLLELGADPDARDARGRTPLEVAMLRGDDRAAKRLLDAGATPPAIPPARAPSAKGFGRAMGKLTPMLRVSDVGATVAWYREIGFTLVGSNDGGSGMDWALVRFGAADIMFASSARTSTESLAPVSLWIETKRLDDLYSALKQTQLERARAVLADGPASSPEIRFVADLHLAFYGRREFGIRDPNGLELMFAEPAA